jgi:hypothetical protein
MNTSSHTVLSSSADLMTTAHSLHDSSSPPPVTLSREDTSSASEYKEESSSESKLALATAGESSIRFSLGILFWVGIGRPLKRKKMAWVVMGWMVEFKKGRETGI